MNKTELKKMKKDELVNLVLTIQNDSIMALELSEMKDENNELKCELGELSESYDEKCSELSDMEEIKEAIDKLDILYDIKDRLDDIDGYKLSVGEAIRLNREKNYINNLVKIVEGLDDE